MNAVMRGLAVGGIIIIVVGVGSRFIGRSAFNGSGSSLELKPVFSGATGATMPRTFTFSSVRPTQLFRLPDDLQNPEFGAIDLEEGAFAVVRGYTKDGTAAMYVDTNRDGDLSNDPPCDLEKKPYKNSEGKDLTALWGSAKLKAVFGPDAAPVNVRIMMGDQADSDPKSKMVTFMADYYMQGQITLAGEKYAACLKDMYSAGSFAQPKEKSDPRYFPKLYLWIDINADGRIQQTEQMDATLPFNIGGTNYCLQGFTRDGSQIRVVKSDVRTPERIAEPADPKPAKP